MARMRRLPDFQEPQVPSTPVVGEGDRLSVSGQVQVTEASAAPKVEVSKPLLIEAIKSSLLEPHELIWFHPGKPKEVARITKWMQAQINAGLLRQV
jgi:hypothetical protein